MNDTHFETTERQQSYVNAQKERGTGIGLVFADAFIRGMRDIGYKSNAWALAEMVDNAVQAGATTISAHFGFDKGNRSEAKPNALALIDNGVGMIPEMISYAVRWGGTDRENDRHGFGRYGYGLPSSAVSICERYTVYSKATGRDWHAVTVDIKELARVASDLPATEAMLEPLKKVPPAWVSGDQSHIDARQVESGTVVVLEKMDRLQWKTTKTLQARLLELFGVIYRHWLPSPKIVVHGTVAESVDPLFLMEAGRYHDETEARPERIETRTLEVETPRGTRGRVKIRASALPPNFQKQDPKHVGRMGANNNRFRIMKEYNGLLICRDGRQIDCVQPRFTKFQNRDINTKIEIDFSPELDEYFGITTAKQQIVIDEVMWDKLEQGGRLRSLVDDIRRQVESRRTELEAAIGSSDAPDTPRASEEAMMSTEKFKTRPGAPSDKQKAEGKKNLEQATAKLAETTGKSKDQAMKELEKRAASRRFEVTFQAIPEGPFYRPHRLGEQKRLIINTQHPFYTKIYSVSQESAAALEVLLLVLTEAELESEGDSETFYKSARSGWSERLRHALDRLCPDDEMRDKASAMAEKMQLQPLVAGDDDGE